MCKIAHRYYGSFQFNYLCDMAEWGKGDPRWIVEERPDGKKTNDTFFYLKYNFQLQIQIIGIGKKKMRHNGQKIN